MKNNYLLIAATVIAASCTDTLEVNTPVKDEGAYVTIEQPDVVSTKGLTYNNGEISFAWESGEQLMVYGSTSSAAIFTINESGPSVARLESPDFQLNEGKEYYVYSPVSGTLSSANKNAVNVSFSGQRQIANTDTKHLSLNQYACAVGTVENNTINFQLYNQVAWIRYSHMFAEGPTSAKTVTISVSGGEPFVVSGTLDATSPVSEKGFTTSITATKKASSITLELGEESGKGIDIAAGEELNAFFTVHPVDLTGKTITITVKDSEDNVLVSNDYYGVAIKRNKVNVFEDDSVKPNEVAAVDGVSYATIKDAIDNVTDGGTITLLANVQDEAIFVAKGEKNFTFDLDGHTFTATAPLAGSAGTENQALHLEAGNTITIKNGTIKAIDGAENIKFIIQNYADLTLEDVTIDAGNLNYPGQVCYALSNNCGNVLLTGNTSIINVPEGEIAMDACKFSSYEKPTVTVSTTGTIEGTIELSGGDLVLGADLKVTKPITGNYAGVSDVNLDGHTLTAPKTAILNDGKATLTIHDGNIVSEGHVGVMVKDRTTTTLSSCNVTGLEGAVGTGTAVGATINIKGGTYIATDNAVIAGNGSKRDGEANKITIDTGTFKGQIKTKGYIACGIYAPWKDIITVNGGDFEITDGVGVLCRGGQVNINGGTFTTSGDGTGWVGDNKNQIACKALVLDTDAKYSDWENAKIVVNNGSFSDSTPTNFVADGYGVVKDGDWYKVVAATEATDEASLTSAISKDGAISVNKSIVIKSKPLSVNGDVTSINVAKNSTISSEYKSSTSYKTLSYYIAGGLLCGEGTIVAPDAKNTTTCAIEIESGKELIINGNLTIKGNVAGTDDAPQKGMASAIVIRNGQVVINGGHFIGGKDRSGGSSPAIILYSAGTSYNATLIINDGIFESSTDDATYLINCDDQSKGKNEVQIKGGTFVGFNPADNTADGPDTDYVADGYVSTKTTYNGKDAWVVTKAE